MGSLTKQYTKEKLTGQIFTPFFIVQKILDDINYNSSKILGKTILDPACGDGRFLIKIAERIIKYSTIKELSINLSKIYGWDIDKEAIELAKKNLNELIKPYKITVNWNIEQKNSLQEFNNKTITKKYDFIVGNPPYIRIQHLELKERKYIQEKFSFCKSGSTDIYIAFYELAIKLLKNEGKCAYITPNTFFHTETAKYLRNYFENHKNLIQITNYAHIQLFDNATSYSSITIFDKEEKEKFIYQFASKKEEFKQRTINFNEIKNQKFWQLSLNKISQQKGTRLGDIANIHVGLTTLADKLYIMPFVKEDENYIYLQSKIKGLIKLEKGILKPIIKVSKLKLANEPIREYILFPYKKVNKQNSIIKEEELKNSYPQSYKYLLSVKDLLDQRDNGKPNKVAWYAYGRSQGLNTSFGKKILFSPMNKSPKFIFHTNEKATFYSGYCIKYEGDNEELLKHLNSKKMAEYIQVSARDFRGGWKAYNKKIVQEFKIEI